jgi:hypothetical protein
MYCVNCGVKLADSEKVCPLCGVAAWHPELEPGRGEPLFPADRYPAYQVSPKGAQIIVTTLFLLPFFISLLCDLQLSGTVTWAGFVMGALAVAYVALVLPLWFQRPNPVIFVPCSFAAVGLYLLYINFATGGTWFLSFAFPVTGYVGLLATAMTALLRYIRRGRLWIFGGALIALGVFMPLMEFLLVVTFPALRFLGWSLYPMTALVLFGGMLLFLALNSRARERMERKFFL